MDSAAIERAIKAVKNEIFMREKVFAKDPRRQAAKVAEMQRVLEVLLWARGTYIDNREEAEMKGWLKS